jgi:flagellar biosynthesis chaperone FliJ
LTRRELFREFSLDPVMSPYFEDNEWCYRVSKARPDCFRRSREALVLHLAQPKNWGGSDFASRSQTVDLLASFARFYQVHGRLLGPWLFHHAQQLCADDGSCDLSAARILMELVAAKGSDWTLMAWMNGDLDSLLTAHSRGVRLENTVEQLENTVEQLENTVEQRENTVEQLENTVEQLEKTVEQLEKTVEQRENTVEHLRAHTDQVEARLKRVEGSVTWQLFQHVRARTFALLGGERSRAVRLFQWVLRLLGRALRREPEDG